MTRGRMIALIAIAAVVLIVCAAWLYLNSASFHGLVREKIVTQLEDATGGRVELKKISWQLSRLDFVIEDLTIHGLEPPTEKPYAHIERLEVRAKIISLMAREVGLNYLGATRPQIHIIVNPDGSTNQPTPKIKKKSGKSPIDQLFDLAIDRMEVTDGELLWNDRKLPLDFSANDVALGVSFDAAKQTYSAKAHVGDAVARYGKGEPLPLSADATIDLRRNSAEVKELRLDTRGSHITASGTINDLSDPHIALKYDATLNVAEFGRAAAIPQARGGSVSLQGEGSAHGSSFESTGRIVAAGLSYHDSDLDLNDLTVASPFTVDEKNLALSRIVGHVLGGRLTGNIALKSWLSKTDQRGDADLKLSSVDVKRVLAAVSTRKLPLERLKVVGSAEAAVSAEWRGSPADATAAVELSVTPPASPAPDQLPLSANVAGNYDARRSALTIRSAEVATRSIHLTATGALGSSTSKLDFDLSASSLNELQPLLQSMGSATEIPVHLNGNARLRGTVRGTVASPQLNANARLADFDLVLSAPQRKQIHWDSFAADIDYTKTSLGVRNGKLTRGKATIDFAGRTTLPKGTFDERSVFSASANITGAPLDDIQVLAGYDYPITGTLNAQGRVEGTKQNMHGTARLTVANGTAYGEAFRNLRADAQLAGQDLRLQNLSLSQNGATLTANGAYNLRSKAFRAEMHARDIDLSHISKLQMQRLTLAGLGTIDATASGTIEQPTIQASVNIREIVANGERIGDIHADAVTQGREMQLKFRSQLEAASLAADGNVHLAGDFPANIAVHFENLDFDPVLRAFFQDRITGHSSMNGRVDVSGPIKRPKLLQVHALIPEVSAQIEKITLTNAEPIDLVYANQVATINRFHLRGEGTDFEARGRVNLADQSIDINAKGDLNLKLAEGFNPDLLSYGTVNMQMAVGGTIKKPLPTGQLTIRDAGVSIIDLPNGLANINGTLVFNENRLQVRSLTANTGGGTLNVGGFISYQNGIYFDLTATGTDVRLRYPPGISASANADLRYTGNLKSSQLSGDVLVTRFGVNPRFDFALYLARGKNPPTAPKANPILDNLRLDVHVTSTPELRVETQLAKISGDVDLRIRGTASKPAVLGRINIAEGDIFFNSTKYHLERGDITFTNPVTIEPILNVEASARVREYDITLGFHGSTAKGINTTYRSEPPLPTADIIALLALGRTREDAILNPPAQQNFAETASNAILGQALDAAVSSRVQKLFGVSRIKIDPQVGGVETATGARITIEQQVNNNVTLTYITNVSRANQQVIQGEFNFTRDISLVIVRDENGVLGFDVRIRQRVK